MSVSLSTLSSSVAPSIFSYTWSLADALKENLVNAQDVDTLLHRSLRLRFELGLFDPIEDQPYWHYSVANKVDTAASQALNVLATRSALVLLKNDAPVSAAAPASPPPSSPSSSSVVSTSSSASVSAPPSSSSSALPLTAKKGRVAVIGPHGLAQRAIVGNYLGQVKSDRMKYDIPNSYRILDQA
jgi:beta-D-xylosidase 4